jgi:predicted nucleotidyltransferase
MDKRAEIITKLKQHKDRLYKEGFEIVGLFGSMARGDLQAGSDLDLLYRTPPSYFIKHEGLEAVARLEEIRTEIATDMGVSVDLVSRDYLSGPMRERIESDLIHV